MAAPLIRPRRLGLLAGLAAALYASLGAGPALPRQILLLHSFDRDFAPYDAVTASFRTELKLQMPVTIVDVSVEATRYGGQPTDQPVLDYIRAIFVHGRPDLVVTIGGPAAAFAQKHRATMFPDAPVLLAAVDQRIVSRGPVTSRDAVEPVVNDFPALITGIRQLLPRTRHVFIVLGASALERTWRSILPPELKQFDGQLTFDYWDQLSFPEMLARARTLPPDSAIFFGLLAVDARGTSISEEQALPALHAVATAPIFGIHSSQIGRGVVGGSVMAIDRTGRMAASMARRLLEGESPPRVTVSAQLPGPPVFDWRELQRWGIAEARLPAGSVVMFREPSTWEQYKGAIILLLAVGVAQTLLIIALLALRRVQRRSQEALRESEARFREMADAAAVSVWVTDADKQCIYVNRASIEFTGLSFDEQLGAGWAQVVHADDGRRCMEVFNAAFEKRESFRMEYRVRRHDGEYRWVLTIGVPRLQTNGAFMGYIGSAIDVTEQRCAHATLSQLSHVLMDAQEVERRRIARELHDDFGQRLAGVTMLLQAGRGRLPPRDEEVRRFLMVIHDQLVEVSDDMRSLAHGLHSPKLDLAGLASTAADFCEDFARKQGMVIAFSGENLPAEIPDNVELAMFRVLQEALANCAKHSHASRVEVSLRGMPCGEIHLEVTDRGTGFDVMAVMRDGGLGLTGMRERLVYLHGALHVESKPGTGTRIHAVVRLPATAPRNRLPVDEVQAL